MLRRRQGRRCVDFVARFRIGCGCYNIHRGYMEMTKMRRLLGVAAILLVTLSAAPLAAQKCQPSDEQCRKAEELRDYIRANYTKYEYMAPMRDGVRLFVSVYAPKDSSKTYPIWMNRTPYSVAPYGVDNYRGSLGPSEFFARDGYIFAYCDVRGQGKSEGTFVHVRPYIPNKTATNQVDEASDTYDTIEFLLKTIPNHNGRVGISGTSYPGFYATMAALSGHPALKAVSPAGAGHRMVHRRRLAANGAFFLAHAFGFFSRFGRPQPGENEVPGPRFDSPRRTATISSCAWGRWANADQKFFKGQIAWWRDFVSHDTYTDYWKSRDPLPYVQNIQAAVMAVGGWFDAEDVYGPPHTYEAIGKQSPGTVDILVEGPWSHGQWSGDAGEHLGDVHFDQKTANTSASTSSFRFSSTS